MAARSYLRNRCGAALVRSGEGGRNSTREVIEHARGHSDGQEESSRAPRSSIDACTRSVARDTERRNGSWRWLGHGEDAQLLARQDPGRPERTNALLVREGQGRNERVLRAVREVLAAPDYQWQADGGSWCQGIAPRYQPAVERRDPGDLRAPPALSLRGRQTARSDDWRRVEGIRG